jgi:hypothetical protein
VVKINLFHLFDCLPYVQEKENPFARTHTSSKLRANGLLPGLQLTLN